jgi:hypothetical protein
VRAVQKRFAIITVSLLGAVAFIVPATASAAAVTQAAVPSASSTAETISHAEAAGLPGVLFQYHPATDSWTQVAVVGNPQTASVAAPAVFGTAQDSTVAEPEAAWSARVACLLVSFTIGACSDVAVTYQNVVPTTDAAIIKSLETIDGDEGKEMREGNNEIEKQREIIDGDTAEEGDTTEGGWSNGVSGVEDDDFDWGDAITELYDDVSYLAFL